MAIQKNAPTYILPRVAFVREHGVRETTDDAISVLVTRRDFAGMNGAGPGGLLAADL